MYWKDEGYLLFKSNYSENSILIETFTLNHGKYTGIVYGGSSRKQKKNFQIGNKIYINWRSKRENTKGYFNVELIKPVAPFFFDDKKKSVSILSAASILKILLPERQINKKIYKSFEKMVSELVSDDWINLYIHWELSLITELGFGINLSNMHTANADSKIIEINNKTFKVPDIILYKKTKNTSKNEVKDALIFNKRLLIDNFIYPNKLKFPLFRSLLESYY